MHRNSPLRVRSNLKPVPKLTRHALTRFRALGLAPFYNLSVFVLQKSSSSESLSEKGSSDLKKSFDAVVFDVLKVTPEQYAVSWPPPPPSAPARGVMLM